MRFACALVLSALCGLSVTGVTGCGSSDADSSVAAPLAEFFAEYLGRPLGPRERQEIAREFVEVHAAAGRDRDAIRANARKFAAYAKVLEDGAKGPAAMALRHERITLNYFDPALQGTLFLRLLLEPDPVRVVDVRSRRLMTEADVVALANIRSFARSQEAPRHQVPTRQQADDLVRTLNATVGGKRGNMPRFFAEAATFWSGVQASWPDLDDNEKALARSYAARTWRVQMPVELHGKLFGLDRRAAASRHADDAAARIAAITDINMQLGNLPNVMDSIFGR